MSATDTLLAVPNVSEGRDAATIEQIGEAFQTAGATLLDTHSDPDHHRTVYTLSGRPGELARAVLEGASAAVGSIDLNHHDGLHPRVGAIDVAPIVYLDQAQRGAACAEALVLGDLLAEQLSLPVFLYGELTQNQRTRAELRRGGPSKLQNRIDAHQQRPDFGPAQLHPTAGAALVAARPPLVAFNVELAPPATVEDARAIAAAIRESGPDGLEAVRAIGLWLASRNVAQVSINIENHGAITLAEVLEAIGRHATPARAELVGLPPGAAFDGYPEDLPTANRRTLEDALANAG